MFKIEPIKICIVGDRAYIVSKPKKLVAGTSGIKVEFGFDSSWNNLTKTAIYKIGSETKLYGITDDSCLIPKNDLVAGEWLQIGVLGESTDGEGISIPTNFVSIDHISEGTSLDNIPSTVNPSLSIYEELALRVGGGTRNEYITLDKFMWVQVDVDNTQIHQQIVPKVAGLTPTSQVDLKPSADLLLEWRDLDLVLTTANRDGVLYVYAIGDKPVVTYENIQISITEVLK